MRIDTKDDSGNPNGYVITLWNKHEQDWTPQQVYLTVIAPHSQKGPHLHMKRCGRFVCIKGDVRVVKRVGDKDGTATELSFYSRQHTGERLGHHMVEVPPGTPAALVNIGDEPAYVINMPSPAWREDDQDEWPVEGWSP